jgi:2-phosphosulfolactate phosphatase
MLGSKTRIDRPIDVVYHPGMSRTVRVHLLPTLFAPEELAGGTAVIIDVLRASTTMTQALQCGARAIVPCETIEEAWQAADAIPASARLLGGERGGVQIEGFDLDNSPRAYTPERVAGRTLVFTTTNGTRALRRAEQARRICVGAFINLQATARYLQSMDGPIHLVCAGTDGRITSEDVLCAGMLADQLRHSPSGGLELADAVTEMAILFAREHGGAPAAIVAALRDSLGGRNLHKLGMEADIDFAARCDTLPIVPVWEVATGELRTHAVLG